MITCILVGGNSQRFKDARYETHKALLPTHDKRVVFDEILSNLPTQLVVISGRYTHAPSISSYLVDVLYIPFISAYSHSIARGPIYGILDASEYLDVDEPVIVSYCDCWVKGGIDDIVTQWKSHESGAINFLSQDQRFGYWHEATEKVTQWIPDETSLAVSGVFYFANGKALVDKAFAIAKPGYGIVHLLDKYTKFVTVDKERIVDVGTPSDYEAYLKSNG